MSVLHTSDALICRSHSVNSHEFNEHTVKHVPAMLTRTHIETIKDRAGGKGSLCACLQKIW